MKNVFKGFYNLTPVELDEVWKNKRTIFAFDTNVLLNLYGYEKQTQEDFFKILEKIDGELWLPYHVALEYQRRRLEVIKNEKAVFNNIESNLEKIKKLIKSDFDKLSLNRRFPKLSDKTKDLQLEIEKSIVKYKKSVKYWDKKQPCVRSHDSIRDLINKHFDGGIGNKPKDQDWLDKIFEEGKERYKNKIPPGFSDIDKEKLGKESYFFYDDLYYEKKYGDLILWKQLLEKAKDEEIESVIFITDDSKEDWWYQLNSNGKKQIGPLADLQTEAYRESKINSFFMYNTSTFLEDGKSILDVEVEKSSIQDAHTQFLHIQQTFKEKLQQQEREKFLHRQTLEQEFEHKQHIEEKLLQQHALEEELNRQNIEEGLHRKHAFEEELHRHNIEKNLYRKNALKEELHRQNIEEKFYRKNALKEELNRQNIEEELHRKHAFKEEILRRQDFQSRKNLKNNTERE